MAIKDPEKRREYNRRYREEHRDQIERRRRSYEAALPPEQREARLAYWRQYYRDNRDAALADRKRHYEANHEQISKRRKPQNKTYWRFKNYGLTQADYVALVESQEGRCPICGEQLDSKKTHVDHCHSTGSVRGVLCHQCNCGIGFLRDDPQLARRAAAYLEEHS